MKHMTEIDRIRITARTLGTFTVRDLHAMMLEKWSSTSPTITLAAKLIGVKEIERIGCEKVYYVNGQSKIGLYQWKERD